MIKFLLFIFSGIFTKFGARNALVTTKYKTLDTLKKDMKNHINKQ